MEEKEYRAQVGGTRVWTEVGGCCREWACGLLAHSPLVEFPGQRSQLASLRALAWRDEGMSVVDYCDRVGDRRTKGLFVRWGH